MEVVVGGLVLSPVTPKRGEGFASWREHQPEQKHAGDVEEAVASSQPVHQRQIIHLFKGDGDDDDDLRLSRSREAPSPID